MTGRINAYRTAVVDNIKMILPAARVEAQSGRFNLEELERTSIRCPAVRVAVLSGKPSSVPSGQSEVRMQCAVFVVTDGKDRIDAAWTMAEAIAVKAHSSQLWGLTRLGPPAGVAITPIVSASIKDRGIEIVAVEWSQELRALGEEIFDADGYVIEELYVNGEVVDLPEPEGGDEQP